MSIETQGNVFVLHVLLIIPQHPESSTRNGPILLHAAKWNEKALKLYEKAGFDITNTERVC